MNPADSGTLARLFRLASPALPIGSYAYSEGLEQAVASGWVRDEASASDWITGLLTHLLGRHDVPILLRLCGALACADEGAFVRWDRRLAASRETPELLRQDQDLAAALTRLLAVDDASPPWPVSTLAGAFAWAGQCWHLSAPAVATAYACSWLEHQTGAAVKLVPLGQTSGQRILAAGGALMPRLIEDACILSDAAIGATVPGQAVASVDHESLYTRLFQS